MALGDIETAILSIVGEALEADSGAYSTTDLDNPINMCLADLSKDCPIDASDTDQTLAADTLTLNHPADFIYLVAITLTNASSVSYKPLTKLPGGHKQYRKLLDQDSNTGRPEWYSDFKEKFWLWRPSSGTFTVNIEYGRSHPETPRDILYSEIARSAIYAGVCYYKSLLKRSPDHVKQWGAVYAYEKEQLRLNWPVQPAITGE